MGPVIRFFVNYRERHLHPVNLFLHAIGVPLTFVVSVIFLTQQQGWMAVASFLTGYALQFIGHAIEGNDAGELLLVKRWLKMPATEFGPQHPSRQVATEFPPSLVSDAHPGPVTRSGPEERETRSVSE